jgi:RNA polymerase sigma-70 factor (ECF subfamily)
MVHFADDLRLVRRLLAGERQAFDGFFSEYFSRLYRFVLVRVEHKHDVAEDLVQDTLCKALRALGSYRGEASLFTWLCQIARNAITDYWRAHPRCQQAHPLAEDDPTIAAALANLATEPLTGPEDERSRQELARLVQVALDALPSHYADALEWKYIDGYSVAEIAERLRQSPVQTQSVLARARSAFREAFQELRTVRNA